MPWKPSPALQERVSVDGVSVSGMLHDVYESEVTLPSPSTILDEHFVGCEVDHFSDRYSAFTGPNNATRKMRWRKDKQTAEVGFKKGIPLKNEHKYIRTRLEEGTHYDNVTPAVAAALERRHRRGGEVTRWVEKERRSLAHGNVQIAQTKILSVSLWLKNVSKRLLEIDLSHTEPYVDLEVESPYIENGKFRPKPVYSEIDDALEWYGVPMKERQSVSTRAIIVEHLKALPRDHELFTLRGKAELIVSKCLRFELADVFTQKGIPKRWKGE